MAKLQARHTASASSRVLSEFSVRRRAVQRVAGVCICQQELAPAMSIIIKEGIEKRLYNQLSGSDL